MNITLPNKFSKVIENNNDLNGKLITLISDFSQWLSENRMEFFPEYTDHGIKHIQSVLDTAESLLTEKSWDIITPEDVYVLTSSIMLHDCAMHITREGLWDLVSNETYNGVLFIFDDEDEWSSRWNDFITDIKKFDESDWYKFFKDGRTVETPNVGDKSLNDDQKIIIGDFIRKHHASIAQIIATYGIPSINGPIEIFSNDNSYLNQLSGLVARSHNYKLRDIVDSLGEDKKREYRKTHPTFIMGLLRVSDYMQFKEDRTPKILFKTKGFCSPVSILEWKKHLAIISTNDAQPDEELIFVEAFPEDATTLIAIKNLLNGFQQELDEFWAIIGEVYSRYQKLKELSLLYRRVKSNIDNPKKYVSENHKSYHPELLSIKSENQKLFPLLIKPLYGDFPEIGIRELLQNSIDACNERYYAETKKNPTYENVHYDIIITLNFNDSTFKISDNGIGMDTDTIKNYFLKVGSSYRTSDIWKFNYTNDDNQSKIPRTGKFGIGMLAGFLIGHSIKVNSKHIETANKGVSFDYKLDSNDIELKYFRKDDIGTEIIIQSNNDVLLCIENSFKNQYKTRRTYWESSILSSHWYYLDSPKIEILTIKDDEQKYIPRPTLISKETLKKEWNIVENSSVELFYWKLISPYRYGSTFCNGILLHDQQSPVLEISLGGFPKIKTKNIDIYIFDNQGIFPLSLTRDKIVTDTFFELEELLISFKQWYKNEIISMTSEYKYNSNEIARIVSRCSFINMERYQAIPIAFHPDGIYPILCDEKFKQSPLVFVDFISETQRRGVIYHEDIFNELDGMPYSCMTECDKSQDVVANAISNYIMNIVAGQKTFRYLKHDINNDDEQCEMLDVILKGWVFVKEYDFKKLSTDYISFLKKNNIEFNESHPDWVIIHSKENKNTIPPQGLNIIKHSGKKFFIFVIYEQITAIETDFCKLWYEIEK